MHMIFNACYLLPPALSMYYYAKNHGSTLHDMENQTGRVNQNIHKEAN